MPLLQLENIRKKFEQIPALDGFSHTFSEGKISAILGPSGCGKSTLLAVIAGLLEPDQGTLYWNTKDLTKIPAHSRNFGLMFQDYALFAHLTVAQNIAYGISGHAVKEKVNHWLERLHIQED